MIEATNTTLQQVEQFRTFVLNHFIQSEESLSLEELFDQWRFSNPLDEEAEADLRAIAASLRDHKSGAQGRAMGEFIEDFKNTHGLSE